MKIVHKQPKDNLELCMKCGGDACYTTELNPQVKNYFCFGCGSGCSSSNRRDWARCNIKG